MPERPDPTAGDHDLTWTELGDGLWLMAAIDVTPAAAAATPPAPQPERPAVPLPEHRRDDVELDEDRTTEEASQTGMWLPVTRRRRGRWPDLTLVVDSSPSMALWTPTASAFARLLEGLGAFRSVRVRLLETGKTGTAEGGEVLGPTLRGGTADAPACGAGEVIGAADRSLLLLLTDGVSDAWHRDLVSPLLARWAWAMPVAIVHLLPQRLWPRCGMAIHQTVLTPPGPLRPNGSYDVRSADVMLGPAEAAELTAGAVEVPVLELQDWWLGWWASMITGVGGIARKAVVVLARDQPRSDDHATGQEPKWSAREKVKQFRGSASRSAFRLATLVAAVPVDVGVARTLQAELVPGSGPDHLAEVFTSGLLERIRDGAPWDRAHWEFSDHVRQLLLRGARRSDTAHAVISASRRFGGRNPVLARLQAALAAPDATPDPSLSAVTKADIALERDLMRVLSGPYLSRADRLEPNIASIGQHGSEPPTTIPAVSDTMSQELKPTGSASEPAAVAQRDIRSVDILPPASEAPPVARTKIVRATCDVTSRNERSTGDDATPLWGAITLKKPKFTGRRELLYQLNEQLGTGTKAVLPTALHGMGGIGKSQMAVRYIYRHLKDYDIVWWIQVTQKTQIRKSLTELAQHLRLPGADKAITTVPTVREALRLGRPYRRWLPIFDSAADQAMVRPFFPVDEPRQILVSSRDLNWVDIARPLEVAVFQRDGSKNLPVLRRSELADVEADLIAEKLRDLPLAIEQAAAWLVETGMPARDYLNPFDQEITEILDTSAPNDYEVSVAAPRNVSFDELSSPSPAAHQLLQVCAFVAPEPISRSLFTGVRYLRAAVQTVKASPGETAQRFRNVTSLLAIRLRSDLLVIPVPIDRVPSRTQAREVHLGHWIRLHPPGYCGKGALGLRVTMSLPAKQICFRYRRASCQPAGLADPPKAGDRLSHRRHSPPCSPGTSYPAGTQEKGMNFDAN